MSISKIRNFFFISLALAALDGCILGVALSSSAGSASYGYSSVDPAAVSPGVLVFGLLLFLAGVVLNTIAWIGSLVRSAQQKQWGWFICMLLPFVNGFALILYVLIGPTAITPLPSLKQAASYQPLPQPAPYQQQYGQPQYGQPQYGQPYQAQQYGEPPRNQPPYGEHY